jgi:hypothetical protein
MSDVNVRNITNSFQDVRLASLSTWKQASEFNPRDHGGPYVILQEGYDPDDPKVIAEEFVLGRSGKWISLGLFYRMPVPAAAEPDDMAAALQAAKGPLPGSAPETK